jgi:putative oxidoreductase
VRWFREAWARPLPHRYSAQTNAALLVGRLLIALPLIPNGFRKLGDFAQVAAAMGGVPQVINGRPFPDQQPLFHFPMPEAFLAASVAFDLLGGLLLLLGWRARGVALLLAGYVAFAMLVFHSDIRGPADVQAILRNLPLFAGLLLLAGTGGGAYGVDGWLARSRDVPLPGRKRA